MPTKFVLKPTSGEMDVRLIADIHDWELRRDVAAEGSMPRQMLFMTNDGATELIYVEDPLLEHRYLVINGPDEERVEQRLRDGLEILGLSDVTSLPISRLDSLEARRLVNAAALMAPQSFDAEFYEFFVKALQHPALEVRRAVLFAVTYVPWKQFRDLLLTIGEQDQAISKDAQLVVQTIDQHGWR